MLFFFWKLTEQNAIYQKTRLKVFVLKLWFLKSQPKFMCICLILEAIHYV